MYTVAFKKSQLTWQSESRRAVWRDSEGSHATVSGATQFHRTGSGLLPLSFSRVSLFILISKWAPKFMKFEMYDL
jgi:hypothetical protein